KVKFPKLSLFLSALREMDVFTDDIILRYGEVNKSEARNESYMAIEIPRLDKTVFLSNEYGEASFIFTGFISDKDLMDHGKQDFLQSPQFLSRIEFVEGKEDEWKVKMKEVLQREVGEKNEKVDLDLLESVREFFSYLGAEEWMGLSQKEKKELNQKVQRQYGFGIDSLCNQLGLNRKNKRLKPLGSSEAMMALGRCVLGSHKVFDEYQQQFNKKAQFDKLFINNGMSELVSFLNEHGYKVNKCMELTEKEREELDQKLKDNYGYGIRSVCTKLDLQGNKKQMNPIQSLEDMMIFGRRVFGPHVVFDEYETRLKKRRLFDALSDEEKRGSIVKFLEKNDYKVEWWMLLTEKEKKILEDRIYEEYGFKLSSLCTKLQLNRTNRPYLSPLTSSEDMMILGRNIFKSHQAFDEYKQKHNKIKRFDDLSHKNKRESIVRFLVKNSYITDELMELTQSEKKELDRKIQAEYGFGIISLCSKIELNLKHGRTMNPVNSAEDMLDFVEYISADNSTRSYDRSKLKPRIDKTSDEYKQKGQKIKRFDKLSHENKKKEIVAFLEKNGYIVAELIKLTVDKKKELDKKIQKEYGFGMISLCLKIKLNWESERNLNPVNSSEDMLDFIEYILENNNKITDYRKIFNEVKRFDNLSHEGKKSEIVEFLANNKYSVEEWMRLTEKQKKNLDFKIQEKYGFGICSLCTKLGLKTSNETWLKPITSPEDMMNLGKELFGSHAVFDECESRLRKIKRFDKLSHDDKKNDIVQFLKKNKYEAERLMNLTGKEKRELEKNIQEKYGVGIMFLCSAFELKGKHGRTLSPLSSLKEMLEFGEYFLGSHQIFTDYKKRFEKADWFNDLTEEKQAKEIIAFFERNGHKTKEKIIALNQKEKRRLDREMYNEYSFRMFSVCTKFGLQTNQSKNLAPVRTSSDMKILGEKIFNICFPS
ncbi:hypothetical protein COB57_05740, partial [Candidatus Peregrinibacteria bacterium]